MHTDEEFGAFQESWFFDQLHKKLVQFIDKYRSAVFKTADEIYDRYHDEVMDASEKAIAHFEALFELVRDEVEGKIHATMANSSFFKHMLATHRNSADVLKRIEIALERAVDAEVFRLQPTIDQWEKTYTSRVLSEFPRMKDGTFHLDVEELALDDDIAPLTFVDSDDEVKQNSEIPDPLDVPPQPPAVIDWAEFDAATMAILGKPPPPPATESSDDELE